MASSNSEVLNGVIARILLAPLRLALGLGLGLAGVLLLAWIVGLVWVANVWPDRVAGMQSLLVKELATGSAIVIRQGGDPATLTVAANSLYWLLFESTDIIAMARGFNVREPASIPDTVVREAWVARHEAIETIMLGTQLLGLRASILTRFFPLLVLSQVVGMAEGLSHRAVRRSRAARESANLYHRAKYGQAALYLLGGVGLLLWPAPLPWTQCAGCLAALAAAMAAGQWSFYKKHI